VPIAMSEMGALLTHRTICPDFTLIVACVWLMYSSFGMYVPHELGLIASIISLTYNPYMVLCLASTLISTVSGKW
jgi:hypothetical protein